MSFNSSPEEPEPYSIEVTDFETSVTEMLVRIEEVIAKFSISSTTEIDVIERLCLKKNAEP